MKARQLVAICIIGSALALSASGTRPALYPGLANELKIINSGDYHKWPKNNAGNYLGSTNYPPEEYSAFFRRFFKENPKLTQGFASYIGYAVFGWFSPEARLNTQRGFCPVVLDFFLEYAGESAEKLAKRIQAEQAQKSETFKVFAQMLAECTRRGHALDSAFAGTAAPRLKELIARHVFLQPATTIDKESKPFVNSYKTLLFLILAEIERDNRELAAELGFSGRRESIWRKHQLFICDNNQLPDRALEIIENILANVPPSMHQLRGITVRDYLEGDKYHTISFPGVVNIFGAPKGRQTENSLYADENSAPAFQIDDIGNLKVERLALTKDETGKIKAIDIAGRKYTFAYAKTKLVTCKLQ